MEEHRVTRQALLQSVKQDPKSPFRDVLHLLAHTAKQLAMNGEEWKENRQSMRYQPHLGDEAECISICTGSQSSELHETSMFMSS